MISEEIVARTFHGLFFLVYILSIVPNIMVIRSIIKHNIYRSSTYAVLASVSAFNILIFLIYGFYSMAATFNLRVHFFGHVDVSMCVLCNMMLMLVYVYEYFTTFSVRVQHIITVNTFVMFFFLASAILMIKFCPDVVLGSVLYSVTSAAFAMYSLYVTMYVFKLFIFCLSPMKMMNDSKLRIKLGAAFIISWSFYFIDVNWFDSTVPMVRLTAACNGFLNLMLLSNDFDEVKYKLIST